LVVANVWYDEPLFGKMFHAETRLVENLKDIDDAGLVVFWGGEDINPAIYGEKPAYTTVSDTNGRDRFEQLIFKTAVSQGKPIVGICRGAQLTCALSGGRLWQHVNNHGTDHMIRTKSGLLVKTTSTHHQMMRPADDFEIIAISEHILSPKKWNDKGEYQLPDAEPEIAFCERTNTLMIQGHPEYEHATPGFRNLTQDLIKQYLGVSA
jgi:GMP synthase-like glutamine amidotransferase